MSPCRPFTGALSRIRSLITVLLACVSLLVLPGCQWEEDYTKYPLEGAAVKGPLANAGVLVYKFDGYASDFKGEQVAIGVTTANADIVGVEIPDSATLIFLVEIVANDATVDLNTGTSPIIPTLKTVITRDQLLAGTAVYATPVTSLAIELAEQMRPAGAYVDIDFLRQASATLLRNLGYGLQEDLDIFAAKPLVTDLATDNLLDIINYRTVVEALAATINQLHLQTGFTLDRVMSTLGTDLADGMLDGKARGGLSIDYGAVDFIIGSLLSMDIPSLPIPGTDQDSDPGTADPYLVADTKQLVADELPVLGTAGTISPATLAAIDSMVPVFMPQVVEGVVYAFVPGSNVVQRWSNFYGDLPPLPVGSGGEFPRLMAKSDAHQRLYLGYNSGRITYIDLTGSPVEQDFAVTTQAVKGLASVGNYVLAQDDSGAWESHYIFDVAGAQTDWQEWNQYSRVYAWNEQLGRVYFFRDTTSPNDLMWEAIDQSTGMITADGETPYHGDYTIAPPIVVSPDGSKVLLGSGDIYDAQTLTWSGKIPVSFAAATWLPSNELVTVSTSGGFSLLRRWSDDLSTVVETRDLQGTVFNIHLAGGDIVLERSGMSGIVFEIYLPSDDSDGDGVDNLVDAFPTDPAASEDSDGDGYPDAWNPGYYAHDSTTGLVLDAYASDSACYLWSHGNGVQCDIASALPDYTPQSVVSDAAGIVYLFAPQNNRVYRWDSVAQVHLNPIVIGSATALNAESPGVMAWSPSHQRLYFGYDSGKVTYIDINGALVEQHFVANLLAVRGLASVGNYVLVQDDNGFVNHHAIFDSNGVQTGLRDRNRYSRVYAWNEQLSRVYFFRDNTSPNDLMWEDIDPAIGAITGNGETPYHGDYIIAPPIVVSLDGSTVLLGSGDFYDASSLQWIGTLPYDIDAAHWLPSGELVTLTASAGDTLLQRFSAGLVMLESVSFAGAPLALLPNGDGFTVVVQHHGAPEFISYSPNSDSDGDGVDNLVDVFPLDPAASQDSDGDGYPDAWNPGYDATDSTTGLVLDAYPNDSACYLVSHGDGVTCDIGSTLPDYTPVSVTSDGAGIVYLFSPQNNRVYRWDTINQVHLNPIIVGSTTVLNAETPQVMAWSPNHQRLYFGYASGKITYIDLAGALVEQPFAVTALAVQGLVAVGNFMLAQDASGSWESHYIFDSNGVQTDLLDWNHYSRVYAWNEQLGRVYFFRDFSSPNDLMWEDIDQSTGAITADGESPYHGDYAIAPPIVVSLDGSTVLLGSGDFYDAISLQWIGALPSVIDAAHWLPNGELVTLTESAGETVLQRFSAGRVMLEALSYTGTPLALLPDANGFTVVLMNNGAPEFISYSPNDDSDGDGVDNLADAFPLDPAASEDSDGDGYPDDWNPGFDATDSTTGLVLDAYPNDSACYLSSQGDGVTCDIASALPNYTPDSVISDAGGIVYLFAPQNNRVYRWDAVNQAHLNPIVVGSTAGLYAETPLVMAYSPNHQRLYFGYDSGKITFIDPAGTLVEQQFAVTAMAVDGLASVGNYVLAQDDSGSWESHYIFDSNGVQTDWLDLNQYSRVYAWNEQLGRVYFFRDTSSPNDLMWEDIDQATGTITADGETPYHGIYVIQPPIVVSLDGTQVLLGSGDFYDASSLQWIATLPNTIQAAHWLPGGELVTLTTSGVDTLLQKYSAGLVMLESQTYTGSPLALLPNGSGFTVVVMNNGVPAFFHYDP